MKNLFQSTFCMITLLFSSCSDHEKDLLLLKKEVKEVKADLERMELRFIAMNENMDEAQLKKVSLTYNKLLYDSMTEKERNLNKHLLDARNDKPYIVTDEKY